MKRGSEELESRALFRRKTRSDKVGIRAPESWRHGTDVIGGSAPLVLDAIGVEDAALDSEASSQSGTRRERIHVSREVGIGTQSPSLPVTPNCLSLLARTFGAHL